jgi:hypothetical protein
LNNPAGARRCVCGKNLVTAEEQDHEQEMRAHSRRRVTEALLQLGSVVALGGVLWAAYVFVERL